MDIGQSANHLHCYTYDFCRYRSYWSCAKCIAYSTNEWRQCHTRRSNYRCYNCNGQGRKSKLLGFLAVILGTLNVVGGFVVTDRMLEMFKSRKRGNTKD